MSYLFSTCNKKEALPPEPHARDYSASRELRAALLAEQQKEKDDVEDG